MSPRLRRPGSGIKLASLPAVLLVPLCCLAAIGAGAVWGAIPGVLKARFGSHEVINTIMLNFIAVALVGYLTQYHYRIPGDPIMESAPIGDAAHIARLGRFVPGLPERIPVNVAFLLGARRVLAGLRPPLEDEVGVRDSRDRTEPRGGRIRRHLDSQSRSC